MKKTVTFAPSSNVMVYYIPEGHGTYDNGEQPTPDPSAWEVANNSKLAAESLKEADANFPSNVMPKRKPLPRGSAYTEAGIVQEGTHVTTEPARRDASVTFDQFVPQEKLGNDETHRRDSISSFASVASFKNLTKKFRKN